MSNKELPPSLDEYLPIDIIEERLKYIKEKEGDKSNYVNLFAYCCDCDIKIWTGRDNMNDFYLFDDYEGRYYTLWNGTETPRCYSCSNNCGCNSQNKMYLTYCTMCRESKCEQHVTMFDKICEDCYTNFMIGKELVKILKEKRPLNFEQLYTYLDQIKL